MKFRDPEAGKVFKDIDDAADRYCVARGGMCTGCVFTTADADCTAYPLEHPREAAEMMGYEVIEEGDDAGA